MNRLSDPYITLNKEAHIYTLTTEPELEFTSVTDFVSRFFEKFDAKKIANNLVATHPKYRDQSAESLIAEWKDRASHGIKIHEEIENCIRSEIQPTEQKAIIGFRWLQRYLMKFDFELFPEVIVYSKELRLAGTIDLLAKDNSTGLYHILDWKTSKSIETSSYNGKLGIKPATENLLDCNFTHYSLQLSLYRYLLEEFYSMKIDDQLIVHIQEDEVHGYIAPFLKDHVLKMLKEYQS